MEHKGKVKRWWEEKTVGERRRGGAMRRRGEFWMSALLL